MRSQLVIADLKGRVAIGYLFEICLHSLDPHLQQVFLEILVDTSELLSFPLGILDKQFRLLGHIQFNRVAGLVALLSFL